mmetsp:Transcript_14905/g.16854  ORF Transcript_14905/g.16854 Transcript_14905/m.16854 type:complete len:576 (+) Transcript_14905:216-1943(+)
MSNSSVACYIYNENDVDAWGDCCDEYGMVPKPLWVLFLITVPVEFIVANSLTVSTAELFEKKKGKEAYFFIGFNLITVALILANYDWRDCGETNFECYQGLLFLFYNSTAAITSLTLWMLVILRKFFPHLLTLLLICVGPSSSLFRTFCEDEDLYASGNILWSWNSEIVRKAKQTQMFWYHYLALGVMLLFGGASHFIPMAFGAYMYISVFMLLMMMVSHTYRLNAIDIWDKVKGPRDQKQHTLALVGAIGVYVVSPVIVIFLLITSPARWLLSCCVCRFKAKVMEEKIEFVLEDKLDLEIDMDGRASEDSDGGDIEEEEDEADDYDDAASEVSIGAMDRRRLSEALYIDDFDQPMRSGQAAPTPDQPVPEMKWPDKKKRARRRSEAYIPPPKPSPPPPAAPAKPAVADKVEKKQKEKAKKEEEEKAIPDDLEDDDFLAMEEPIEEARKEKPKKGKKKKKKKKKRKKIFKYILDILKKLCMYDPLDRVIVFAGATILTLFTVQVNYGILLFSGAPYIEAPKIDMLARGTSRYFECTVENFADFNALGVVDFIGLGITVGGIILQLPTVISMILDA